MKKVIYLAVLLAIIFIPLTIQAEEQIYQVTTDNLNVREGPSYQADVLAQLDEGDQVRVFEEFYGWVKTYLDGQEVWVAKHYLVKLDSHASETEVNHHQSSNPINSTSATLDGYNIVLDFGHGGKDVGAIGAGGVFEKDLLLQTGLKVAEELREAGATVILTRQDDTFLSLGRRAELSNLYLTHAFISLHYDSYRNSSASGTTVFYFNDSNLASSLHHSLDDYTSLKIAGSNLRSTKY
nr:N-acetylmuramoyl-L-alanine amidase [Piscibacillus salipiscarius]